MFKSVLIVEDLDEPRQWMEELVIKELSGVEAVHSAASLSEAYEHMAAHHFQLALVDWTLPDGVAEDFMNLESILTCGIGHPHWEAQVKGLIERHYAETGSRIAGRILADWEAEKRNFLQVCPKEMLVHLAHPLSDEAVKVPAE